MTTHKGRVLTPAASGEVPELVKTNSISSVKQSLRASDNGPVVFKDKRFSGGNSDLGMIITAPYAMGQARPSPKTISRLRQYGARSQLSSRREATPKGHPEEQSEQHAKQFTLTFYHSGAGSPAGPEILQKP